jgi:hypothetical protein
MFCNKCGNQIKDGAAFCNSCGTLTKSGGTNPPLQSSVTSAVTHNNPVMPKTGGTVATAKKPIRINKKIALISAILVVVTSGVFAFTTIQENRKQEIAALEAAAKAEERARIEVEEQARIEAELTAIEGVISSYESAFESLNFEYAANFCVPGAQVNQRILSGLPSITIKGFSLSLGDILSSAGSFLNWVADLADLGFRYSLDYNRSDIILTDEKATVNVVRHVSCVYLIDTTANQTITFSKSDGKWLIEDIR